MQSLDAQPRPILSRSRLGGGQNDYTDCSRNSDDASEGRATFTLTSSETSLANIRRVARFDSILREGEYLVGD